MDRACIGKGCADECQDVFEHEALYAIDAGAISKTSRMKAASSLNGCALPQHIVARLDAYLAGGHVPNAPNCNDWCNLGKWAHHADDGDVARINNILNSCIRYVGVAVTGCKGGAANALQRQGYSATRGGLNTIINTGSAAIMPGQKIRVGFDIRDFDVNSSSHRNHVDGIPDGKIILRTAPVVDDDDVLFDLHGLPRPPDAHHIDEDFGPFLPDIHVLGRDGLAFA